LLLLLVLLLAASEVRGSAPEPGIWNFVNLTGESNYVGVVKNAFKGSRLDIRVDCQTESASKPVRVLIGFTLRRTVCWDEFLALDSKEAKEQQVYRSYYDNPSVVAYRVGAAASKDYVQEYIKEEFIAVCNQDFTIPPHETYRSEKKPVYELEKDRQLAVSIFGNMNMMRNNYERQRASDADEKDGVYLLVVHVAVISNTQPVTASVHVQMRSPTGGFLSLVDWPLLPFYATMCGVYAVMGLVWLIVCRIHRSSVLGIHFGIGGVIFWGLVENAMFLAEFLIINNLGQATEALMLVAEVVSSGKRALARMLVICVSSGCFEVVNLKTGPLLNRVLGTGGLYFILASIEACLRVTHPKNDPSNKTLLVAVPLSIVDLSIFCWIFYALFATIRTLRLQNNQTKLSQFKHFTIALALAVIASIAFIIWSIAFHKVVDCLTQWKDLWVDEAFWHLLFSILLVVIMILWRPTEKGTSGHYFSNQVPASVFVIPDKIAALKLPTAEDPQAYTSTSVPVSLDAAKLPAYQEVAKVDTGYHKF